MGAARWPRDQWRCEIYVLISQNEILPRRPERFARGDKLHRHFGNERLEPLGAIAHTRLFGNRMAQDDHPLLLAGGDHVLRVLDAFPLARFSDHYDIHTIA